MLSPPCAGLHGRCPPNVILLYQIHALVYSIVCTDCLCRQYRTSGDHVPAEIGQLFAETCGILVASGLPLWIGNVIPAEIGRLFAETCGIVVASGLPLWVGNDIPAEIRRLFAETCGGMVSSEARFQSQMQAQRKTRRVRVHAGFF